MAIQLKVNGKDHSVDVDPTTPLLWVIREQIGLTGTKYACGIAQCGSCTVMLEGQAIRSCVIPVSAAAGRNVQTVEGLATNGKLTKLQQAWIDHQVPQCGFCQSGMLMAATDLLAKKPKPTDADIDAAMTNICRCGSFQEVRAAIHSVAKA
jgi:isoquinoline 1-oxidoreductase alpha subunit